MMWFAVFIGGGIGSLMRYSTGLLVNKYWQHTFPFATLISNFVACIILAAVVVVLRDKVQQAEWWYAFLVIGICGGYSTFSTFARENAELIHSGNYGIVVVNILLSLALCVGVILLTGKNSTL